MWRHKYIKTRIIRILGTLALLAVLLIPAHNADAATKFKGISISDTGDGIHAYISTMNMNTVGGPFTFYATTPDKNQDYLLALGVPGGGCLEVNTEALRVIGNSTTYHRVGVYNLCTGAWAYQDDLTNATVRSNYARTLTWNDTGTAYTDEVVEARIIDNGSNCFAAYLYNGNTATYDQKASYCGSTGGSTGYATYDDNGDTQNSPNPQCFSMAGSYVWQIRGLQERHGVGNWSNIGSGDIAGTYSSTEYCFDTIPLYQIISVAPQVFKIRSSSVSY